MGARRTATRACIFCTFNGCKEDGDAALDILMVQGGRRRGAVYSAQWVQGGRRRGAVYSTHFNGCKEGQRRGAVYSAVLMGARRTATRRSCSFNGCRRTATRRCIFCSFNGCKEGRRRGAVYSFDGCKEDGDAALYILHF
ncbi:hypothetical protein EVAR_35345_1 [Eumeta japonica]|uniref:Uncharacterized protein n=1 Tax=Eumeta variegata TaxID=151549 RepID=A0A4C1XML2_EUMVA|nr:hypothetical protein EVAR_35345_1 [Eumeta japonica]